MRLWSAEIDAMRAEARAVVQAGFASLHGATIGDERPDDPVDRVLQQRRLLEAMYQRVPEVADATIAGVRCRTFVPEGVTPIAVYLHFHGGGMITGAPEMNDVANVELARRHGLAFVSVDYRLAPEHPYPAGPDDGVAVAGWLLEHANEVYGTDRIIIGGESAGGYMSAAVLLRVRDELGAAGRFVGANLVFGVYDFGRTPSQRGIRPTSGPDLVDPDGIKGLNQLYLPGMTDEERRRPSISPLFADLSGLCPAFISAGTDDHLIDDTLMLAPRWAAAGNDVELFIAPDMPHSFNMFPCGITTRWNDALDQWFEQVLALSPV